jgi:hypothetical protein
MPSQSFIQQDKIGKKFEALVKPHLSVMGLEAISTSKQRYRQKKGRDFLVKIKNPDGTYKRDERGYLIQCNIEVKLDAMSEITQNVCVDLDSINKSTSSIWIYGLPVGPHIDLYAMYLADLGPYAFQHPNKRPVGEFGQLASLIPKDEFTSLPFIKKLKTIDA